MKEFLHVQHVEFTNFKALKEAALTIAHGAHCYVVGPNREGKTTFLDFIFTLLSRRLKDKLTMAVPTEMIHNGADRMEGFIDLGRDGELRYRVKVAMSRKGGTLDIKVYNESGQKISPSRKILDELVGVIDFDIKGFLNLTPKEKVKFMKEWTGIDFSDLEEALKEAREQRRSHEQQLTALEAQLMPLLPFDATQIEPRTLEAINEKRTALLARQERYDDFAERVADIEKQLDWDEKAVRDLDKEVLELRERITFLEQKRQGMELQMASDMEKVAKGKAYLESTPRPDISEIDSEYAEMIAYNEQVAKNRKALDLNQRIGMVHTAFVAAQTEEKSIEATLKAEIMAAKLPVPGLSFDENGLYLNGLPFESSQINTAELVIAGIQLQLPLMKHVGIARFDASLLDKKNRIRVEAWANAQGIQLFEEEVDRESDAEGIRFVLKDREEAQLAIAG